jgi:hypothetical protein
MSSLKFITRCVNGHAVEQTVAVPRKLHELGQMAPGASEAYARTRVPCPQCQEPVRLTAERV